MSPTLKHTILTALIVIGAGLAALAKAEPALPWVGVAMALVGAVAQIFTDSPGTAAKMARLTTALGQVKAEQVSRGTQRGFAPLRNLVALTLGGIVGLVGYAIVVGATASCGTLSNPVISTPAANFAACVIVRAATDAIEGMPANKVTADVIDTCGCPDTANPAACTAAVNQILDAEAKARTMRASYADGGR